MVYIQVYISDKNKFVEFKVSQKLSVCDLKSLLVEYVYNVRYDKEFISANYSLFDFNHKKKLKDDLKLFDYGVYNGYKVLLI